MRLLRTAAYLVTLFVATLYYGGSAILAALFRVPPKEGGVYDRAARGWSRHLLRAAGVPVSMVGFERVPAGRPVVYLSNHQSWFDILALASTLPGTVRFVSKIELAKVPILGSAMRSAGHIFLNRQNRQAAFEAYEETARVIRDGTSAIVFAEGTRSRTGRLLPFKKEKGPFVFAIAAQVPVVPVYCAHTFEIMPKGTVMVRPQPIELWFGEPIETAGLGYDDRTDLLERTRVVIEQLRIDSGDGKG